LTSVTLQASFLSAQLFRQAWLTPFELILGRSNGKIGIFSVNETGQGDIPQSQITDVTQPASDSPCQIVTLSCIRAQGGHRIAQTAVGPRAHSVHLLQLPHFCLVRKVNCSKQCASVTLQILPLLSSCVTSTLRLILQSSTVTAGYVKFPPPVPCSSSPKRVADRAVWSLSASCSMPDDRLRPQHSSRHRAHCWPSTFLYESLPFQ
jgi:hypothetical protein